MVRSHGNSRPLAFFIADAPFGEDLKSDYALTGYQENMLESYCRENHLSISDFWRACLIREELKVKSEINSADNKDQIPQYSQYLINEIQTLNPHLLIPLGELSFNYLTGMHGIRKFRGSVLPSRAEIFSDNKIRKVMPILGPHPFLNQEYRLRFVTRADFQKIPKHLNESPIPDNLYNIWVAKSSAALRVFLDRSYKSCVERIGFLVFDIETYMGIPTCISFCFDGFESVCVPLLDYTIDLDNRVLMMDMVAKVLASPLPKINQNIKYDWKILERWGFFVNNVIGDTAIAASVIYCEFPKNLGFLTSIYTDLPYFKDEGKEFDPAKYKRETFYLYNAKDSLACYQIMVKQIDEMRELGVEYVYKKTMSCLRHYKKMDNRGIMIDPYEREKLTAKYDSLYEIEKIKLKRLVGTQYINPLSSQMMQKLVYEVLGYEPVRGVKRSDKTGLPGADEESLNLLMAYGSSKRAPSTGPQILQSIANCRKIHKVIEILELPLYPDGAFRCEFNLGGTETGRSSAGESLDQIIIHEGKGKVKTKYMGHSLQTIGKHGFLIDGITFGKDLRRMFVPRSGYKFVEIDLSGAEARVDRVLSGNFDLDVFSNPGIHKYTGSLVYNCKPSEIKKNVLDEFGVDRYHMSKTVRHSAERNAGPGMMVVMTGRSYRECEILYNNLHKAEPAIKEVFHRDIRTAVDNDHCLVMPNGRRRDFFDRITKSTYNEAISTPPQAIVSDQTKFEGIDNTLNSLDWAFLLTEQHDGVLFEVPIGREMEFSEIYKRNVETPINFRYGSLKRDYDLIIPAEVSIGDNWYGMEEVKM